MMGVPFPPYGGNQNLVAHNGTNGGGVLAGDNCSRCGYQGSDVRMMGCGCTTHTRCIPLMEVPLTTCPQCSRPVSGIVLVPMSFREMDEARKTAAALASHGGGSTKHGKKRKAGMMDGLSSLEREKGGEESDQRTGRWTAAETAYVDELIARFEGGSLPLVDGIKLNDFLAGMLQCKQSRLTKKMKNAKLSSKCFKRTTGYIADPRDAREFSALEEAFFHSIHCHEERAEIRFHMQKQWRELFSSYCVGVGQPLDADSWLNSVEEIERRASMAKDAARMVRRKLMMGKAYNHDIKNSDRGVIIDRSETFLNISTIDGGKAPQYISNQGGHMGAVIGMGGQVGPASLAGQESDEILTLMTDKALMNELNPGGFGTYSNLGHGSTPKNLSPYLDKAVIYLQRSSIPFEHVDAWVPSFVPTTSGSDSSSTPSTGSPKCRLCFAGCATVDMQATNSKGNRTSPMSTEEHFNLLSFGEYSQKFSFDIGCGLPGRVYQSGIPTWEQSVHNAPLEHFERCGGAVQCGIRTVVGIPVPSPNVGRIVVVLYSCHDREKDQELVGRLCEEFTRLLPTPRWKLIVDLGHPNESSNQQKDNAPQSSTTTHADQHAAKPVSGVDQKDSRVEEVVTLLGEHMPSDSTSPLASYLPGFMTLRLLMLRTTRTEQQNELVRTMLDSYASYTAAGRSPNDIALLLARDCMFLSQQSSSQSHAHTAQVHQPQGLTQSVSASNPAAPQPPNPTATQGMPSSAATSSATMYVPINGVQTVATNSYVHSAAPPQAAPAAPPSPAQQHPQQHVQQQQQQQHHQSHQRQGSLNAGPPATSNNGWKGSSTPYVQPISYQAQQPPTTVTAQAPTPHPATLSIDHLSRSRPGTGMNDAANANSTATDMRRSPHQPNGEHRPVSD